MYQRIIAAIVVSASLCFAQPVLAWGDDGHELIADIAYGLLTPHARASVDAMLAGDNDPLTPPDFASRATWADKYRDADNRTLHYQATRQWHFVDIELSAPDIDAACFQYPQLKPGQSASAGPENDCVAHKITQFAAELGDRQIPAAEQLMALKFVMHFIGDIHQPLHSSDDHDAGGNCEQIRVKPGGPSISLHRFWDVDVIDALLLHDRASHPGATQAQFADRIRQGLTPAQVAAWQADSVPEAWALQAFAVAKSTAYNLPPHAACTSGEQPAQYPPFELPAEYQTAAVQAALTQIEAAGVRLAATINRAFP